MEKIFKNSEKKNEAICSLIGERIKRIRKERNIGQDEFGRKMGVTRQTVSAWERNGSALTISQLLRISSVLRAPVTSFLTLQPIEILPTTVADREVYELSMAFEDEKTRDMAVELMQIISDLSTEDISCLKHIASTMAEKKQAADDAYRKGFLDASVFCGICDAEDRDGYTAGQEAFEADLSDRLLSEAQENMADIEQFEDEYDVKKCDYQEAHSIMDSVSDSIFDTDKDNGYSEAETKYKESCADWDDLN